MEKVEIKLIENKKNRHVAFSRRRKELFKQTQQLCVQNDVEVAAIVFSNFGRLYQCSHGNRWSNLDDIFQQYHDACDVNGKEATGIYKPKNLECEKSSVKMNLLERVERYFDELNLDQLSVADLAQLEKDLETTLLQTRRTNVSVNTKQMMEPIKSFHEKEKSLREENELLMQQVAAMRKENTAAKEMDDNMEVDIELRNLANNETDHPPPQQTLRLLL